MQRVVISEEQIAQGKMRPVAIAFFATTFAAMTLLLSAAAFASSPL